MSIASVIHLGISSSDTLFSSCPQSFPASGTFAMSQLFTSDDQNTGVSASASVLPINIQLISLKTDWFDLLAVQETLRSLLQHHCSKTSILRCTAFFTVQFSQLYMITVKTIALTIQIQKNIYFCFIDYAKAFDCMDHHKLWKILKEMRILDHFTYHLRNLLCRSRSNS